MMADEFKWITLDNGTHIPISPGQTKEEAVKEFTEKAEYKEKLKSKSIEELKSIARSDKVPKARRRTISKSEVSSDGKTYNFPTDLRISIGSSEFKFNTPINVTNAITIFKPDKLREQVRISQNYGGRFGEWSKKAGSANVEVSGNMMERQVHWYENSDGTIAGVKIKRN